MAFKSARCPNCSGDLSLDPAMDKGFCMHCGSEIIVEDAIKKVKVDGVVSAENLITMAANARELGDYKEAYDYYTKALEIDPENIEVMLKRAFMAGMLAKFDNSKIDEFINSINMAINKAPDDEKNSLKIKASSGIKEVVTHLQEKNGLYLIRKGHTVVNDFYKKIINVLDIASEYDPQNREANLRLLSGMYQSTPGQASRSTGSPTDPELIELIFKKDDELKQIDPTHKTRMERDENHEKKKKEESNKYYRDLLKGLAFVFVVFFLMYIFISCS